MRQEAEASAAAAMEERAAQASAAKAARAEVAHLAARCAALEEQLKAAEMATADQVLQPLLQRAWLVGHCVPSADC